MQKPLLHVCFTSKLVVFACVLSIAGSQADPASEDSTKCDGDSRSCDADDNEFDDDMLLSMLQNKATKVEASANHSESLQAYEASAGKFEAVANVSDTGPIVSYTPEDGYAHAANIMDSYGYDEDAADQAPDMENDKAIPTSRLAPLLFTIFASLAMVTVGTYIKMNIWTTPGALAAKAAVDDSSLGLQTQTKELTAHSDRPRRGRSSSFSGYTAAVLEKVWTIHDVEEPMSSFTFVVNMFADLCPPGFLPLAYGLRGTGYLPAFFLLVFFCALCVYTMLLIAKTSEITGQRDFAGQWEVAIGKRTAWVPVLVVVLICFGCNVSYSCFFADIFTGVMPSFGVQMPRWMNLLLFTIFPLLPLCLLKNLSALGYSSTFALFAVIYTAGMMVIRASDGTYKDGGLYYATLSPALAPRVPSEHLLAFGMPSLVLLNALAMAFVSHYNGCKYYRELEARSPQKLVKCTATAMAISAILFAVTAYAGFSTFGKHADGVVLKNYSRVDPLANIARLGVGLSIICSFPLMFSGLREAVIALIRQVKPEYGAELDIVWKQDVLSMCLLFTITSLALLITDAGLVVGLVGSVCGSAIIYIVPCTLYSAAVSNSGLVTETDSGSRELMFVKCLTVFGATLGALGCLSTLIF